MPAHNTNLRSNIEPHTELLSLLAIATFFEGFGTKLAGLVQPLLGREWGASTEELGLVLGLSSLGMVLAFFVIHLADWIGRRPVFLGALADRQWQVLQHGTRCPCSHVETIIHKRLAEMQAA
ncbi:MAG: hypothetical protein NZ808_06470 [Myxococcota bacterium]|nr:hypothetical protein [Myxococcota bacterium]